nr:hypothetical protein [Mycoplasmopsis bovis]
MRISSQFTNAVAVITTNAKSNFKNDIKGTDNNLLPAKLTNIAIASIIPVYDSLLLLFLK